MITTKTHGTIDYIVGAALILAPFIFGFATGGAEMWVPILVGAAVILYSMFTAYEKGITSSGISMSTHLWLDAGGGAFLALSPWLFGFAHIVFLPHLIVGIAEILTAMMTEKVPREVPRHAHV